MQARNGANHRRMKRPTRESKSDEANLNHVALLPVSCTSKSVIARKVWLRQNAMMSSKTQIPAKASSNSKSVIFFLLCAGFVVNGIVISFIGPVLPEFMAKWGLDDSRAGLFSLVQFSASLAGVLISSALISAKGFKPAITLGLVMLGLGFALLNARTFPLALAASGIYGLGYGFNTPGTNLWVGETYGNRRASALNIMNLAWGAGAISSSPLAMLSVRTSHVTPLLYLVGTICAALALLLLRMPFGKPHQEKDPAPFATPAKPAGNGVAALLGILFFVYVGRRRGATIPGHSPRCFSSQDCWVGVERRQQFFFDGKK
jgi:MFS family permease